MVARHLGRADVRRLAGPHVQPPGDLMLARLGRWVFVGVRNGGRVRLSLEQARQVAGSLLEVADDDPGRRARR